MKLSFIHIILSILLFTSPDFAKSKEISNTLYYWETSLDMEWVTLGVDDIHPKYEGETKNEEPNGIGTLTYPNGHKFEGEWNDGKQHGRGTYTWSDGREYTGIFKNGKPYGQGTYTYLDGTKNLGKWEVTQENFLWKTNIKIPFARVDKKMLGVLAFRKENERWAWYDYGDKEVDGKYVGEIKNLKPDGSGTYTYGKGKWEGDKYEGMWKRGEFYGRGTYPRSNGHKFVGEWKNNVLNDFTEYDKYGIIVRKYVNGVKVVLEQKTPLNKKRDRGTLFRDGPRIKWEEGGKKWFTTGDEKTQGKYEGEILDGVPHGQGTYYWFNVNRYEGEWGYGLFNGQGTYYSYPSEVRVIGEFRRDKEWNTLRYDKEGNIIEKIVRGKLKKD